MPDSKPRYEIGVIHGRFQVLHNDHLKYLLAGKALCRHLVVGITNPEPLLVREESADPRRSDQLANPLTYYERYQIVRSVLAEQGIDYMEFSIVPLPINLPERYHHYVPMDAMFFLSIYDDWGKRKQHYFESLGLRTHIIREVPPGEKGLSATDVREAMRCDKNWSQWVPPAAERLLIQWQIADRLKMLDD